MLRYLRKIQSHFKQIISETQNTLKSKSTSSIWQKTKEFNDIPNEDLQQNSHINTNERSQPELNNSCGLSRIEIAHSFTNLRFKGERVYEFLDRKNVHVRWKEKCFIYLFETKEEGLLKFGISWNVKERSRADKFLYHKKIFEYECSTRAEAFCIEIIIDQKLSKKWKKMEKSNLGKKHNVKIKSIEITDHPKKDVEDLVEEMKKVYSEVGTKEFIRIYLPDIYNKYYDHINGLLSGEMIPYCFDPIPEKTCWGGVERKVLALPKEDIHHLMKDYEYSINYMDIPFMIKKLEYIDLYDFL